MKGKGTRKDGKVAAYKHMKERGGTMDQLTELAEETTQLRHEVGTYKNALEAERAISNMYKKLFEAWRRRAYIGPAVLMVGYIIIMGVKLWLR